MASDREKTISRVTVCGAAANVALAAVKLVAGVVGRSSAMVADAIHSFSDLVSDIIVLVMVKVSSRGQDTSHDYGHGKFETLATVGIALLLVVVGARLLAGGVEKISFVLKGGTLDTPGTVALVAAVLSIAVKEALYQWTAHVGRSLDSSVMITNAWHHRTDALSSVASAAGIALALLLGGRWAVLDPVVCCAISIFIFYIAVKMAIPALNELTEASLPDSTEKEISSIICSVSGVDNVHALKTRRIGPDIYIESHIVVNPYMKVIDAHRITEVAEQKLRQKYGQGTQISLHVEPSVESD